VIVPVLQLQFPQDSTTDERDLVAAALPDVGSIAVHETGDLEWRVFFRSVAERDQALLAGPFGRATAAPLDLADEDWVRRSQSALKAVRIGDLVVAPPWDVPDPAGRSVILIEPSVGFGTGHHATTRLCLRALQKASMTGKTVLDIGTGSGVLAIAAAKLGASRVVAVDNDPDALEAARLNVARNSAKVELQLAELSPELPRGDVVLANLTGAVLRRHAAALASLARGGVLIISGLLEDEAADVQGAFAPLCSSIEREDEDGWVAFTLSVE
jgi:ribosomal protein L11 methyltransferase